MHHLELASEFESDIRDTANWGMKWLVVFNAGKTQPDLFDQSKTLVLLVWKWMGLFLRKNLLLRCWGWLSLLNWIGAVTLSLLLKLALKELEKLFLWSLFLSLEVALYLYKSVIQPCIEYRCHVWDGAPSYYLELLNKLQKQITQDRWSFICCFSWALGLSWKWSQLKSSTGILLVDVHLNFLNWFHFLFLEGGLLVILIDCMIFLSPFLDVSRMYMSTVSFLTQLGSGILLPIECFPLIYDLSGFNSRIKKHLLTVTSF